MTWVKLDDQFHSNPKALAAGLDGCGLYARALSYVGAHLLDGIVPREWIENQRAQKVAVKLIKCALFSPHPDGFEILDYLEFNPSREEVLARRRTKQEAGRRGGIAKANALAVARGSAKGVVGL